MIEIQTVPHLPGCYLFKDAEGSVIYVGKARDLRKRVGSYFQGRDRGWKTDAILSSSSGIDFIVTDNEVEALILENTLIKKHSPKYNIRLKDSSSYASIHMTGDRFPRICIARRMEGPGEFFGPFVSARERDYVLSIVRRTFGLRTCRRLPRRACLRYHMGACSGPCIGMIREEEYQKRVSAARMALKGRIDELVSSMRRELEELSARQEFERAIEVRDGIYALISLQQRQNTQRNRRYDEDILNYIVEGQNVYLMLFKVYKGTLEGKEDFVFPWSEDFLEEFLVQYYSENVPPEELIVPVELDEAQKQFLDKMKGRKVRVTVPQRGEKKELLDLVWKNVKTGFFQDKIKVQALQEKLGLHTYPNLIECFDISHLAGTYTVGSMVQFRGGRPDRSEYRRFRIKSVEGIDDIASVAEVVRRRYSRIKRESSLMPDLIIIDGGKAQLSAALGELVKLEVRVPVISIAKREEKIYVPGLSQPLLIKRDETASLFVQEIRDEAHRFAVKYNRLLRQKAVSL